MRKYSRYASAEFCRYDKLLCRCINQALGVGSIFEVHKQIFPGYHKVLSKHIYYITIAFCSCKRGAEKIRSMASNQQASAAQE